MDWYVERNKMYGWCVRTRDIKVQSLVRGEPDSDGFVAHHLKDRKTAELIAAAPQMFKALTGILDAKARADQRGLDMCDYGIMQEALVEAERAAKQAQGRA